MINGQTITLIIPCKNEAASLPRLLNEVPACIDEILIIDNNSSDDTALVAKKLGARVITERRVDKHGIGYGFAHQAGIKAAQGDIIVTMDGDGTYPMKQIKMAVHYLQEKKLDFVSCNRFPLIHKKAISIIRKIGVIVLNTEVHILHGYPIKDILSGMWVVRKTAAKRLTLKEGGWNLSPEIKLQAIIHKNVTFAEFHIDHNYRTGGASKQQIWQTGFDHLLYILHFKLKNVSRLIRTKKASTKKAIARYIEFYPATSLE